MTIYKKIEENKMILELEGRLDSITAPVLEEIIKNDLGETKELVFDFQKMEYISSAGLRVLLAVQRKMNKQGSMKVIHVNEVAMEIFAITGFKDILMIE